jgi:hypothetical protein
MISLSTLKQTADKGLKYLRRQKDLVEAEVFVASNATLTARLNFTSHIPCNGVEEPKSLESCGLGIRAVFHDPRGPRIGLGSESGNLTLEGIQAALEKARRGAVHDPEFTTLPTPSAEKRTLTKYHDAKTMDMKDNDLVHVGWRVLNQALGSFETAAPLRTLVHAKQRLRDLGLLVGGDVTV